LLQINQMPYKIDYLNQTKLALTAQVFQPYEPTPYVVLDLSMVYMPGVVPAVLLFKSQHETEHGIIRRTRTISKRRHSPTVAASAARLLSGLRCT
jgi:hypothetical protein